ncbi:MAG: hypothetical protein N2114_01025 [Candidatus Goldbacteria bacterium]|nr:hypothetical protein [Candidatus Goldiibacteriota bacterium]
MQLINMDKLKTLNPLDMGMGDGIFSVLFVIKIAGFNNDVVMALNKNRNTWRKIMSKFFSIFITSIVFLFSIFSLGWADVKKSSQCMFLIDGSLSYKSTDKAKESLKNIIMKDNSCVKIYVRWISDDSYLDKNIITSQALNDVNKINNPFGIKAKKIKEKLIKENEVTKKNIINAVNSSKSPNSQLTDIYGALMASSVRFMREPNLKPMLYIFSDLEDDANKKNHYEIKLNGVTVYVMDFQTNNNSEFLKNHWTRFFKNAGAQTVDIMHLDEPITRYTRR